MKTTTTPGSGTVNKLREYKVNGITEDAIKDDFITSCFQPKRKHRLNDIQILVVLIVFLMVATISLILNDRQMAIVEDLHSTVDQMVDIQKDTISWVSDIEEMAIDNHLRLVELEGK